MQHRSVSSSYRGNPSPPLPNFRGGTIYSRLEATTLSIDHHPKPGCGVAQKGGGKTPPPPFPETGHARLCVSFRATTDLGEGKIGDGLSNLDRNFVCA